jgi:hypothetical protein
MFEWLKARVLRLMRVPHEPEPPTGAPGSVRVFRAGINHYRLRVLRWYFGQAGALVGIGFSVVFIAGARTGIENARTQLAAQSARVDPAASPTPWWGRPVPGETEAEMRQRRARERDAAMKSFFGRTPGYAVPLIEFFEFVGIALFLFQFFVTYAIVRLEFEQHWYIVTDRSLRIRTGVLRLQESTMSFANLQQVEIRQGPLQRFLGLADVCVRSAGGGDPVKGPKGHGEEASLHLGVFQGVANAVEIRDLILERLRKFREAGLGDPEDARAALAARHKAPVGRSLTDAMAELLGEARALRRAAAEDSTLRA